jgi:preprotein translocase subunit SecA
MTGTARAAAAEFNELYGMNVVVIPTHRPCVRIDHPDLIFTHQEAKQKAILTEIVRAHALGQPILVGTGSIAESENLARKLKEVGIECQVLNAKNDEKEAAIISRAGEPGAVTVSTNMAGRGIDIKLGGAFSEMQEQIEAEVVKYFNLVEITAEGVDLEREGLKGPSSTLTYLIDDSPDQFSRLPFLIKLAKNSISGPLLKLQKHYHQVFGQGNGK